MQLLGVLVCCQDWTPGVLSGSGALDCSPACVSGNALWFGPGIATLTLLSALLPGLSQGIAMETALGHCSWHCPLDWAGGCTGHCVEALLFHMVLGLLSRITVPDYCPGLLSRITVPDY